MTTTTSERPPPAGGEQPDHDGTVPIIPASHRRLLHGWRQHPAVRSGQELTRGERSADRMRNTMGSWTFVFGALIFLAIWMAANAILHGFDRYPFILLNLVLSCLAALQGAILLIAAKRADQISAELAQHTFEVDRDTLELTRKIDHLTQLIHTRVYAGDPGAYRVPAPGTAGVTGS